MKSEEERPPWRLVRTTAEGAGGVVSEIGGFLSCLKSKSTPKRSLEPKMGD